MELDERIAHTKKKKKWMITEARPSKFVESGKLGIFARLIANFMG